jgi:hypothetical protein
MHLKNIITLVDCVIIDELFVSFFLKHKGPEGPGAVLNPRGYRPDYIKGL